MTMTYRPRGLDMEGVFRWFMPGDPPEEGCWEWPRYTNEGGYGVVGWAGKLKLAHVMSYEILYGELEEGQVVRHTCDNPPCVLPTHLIVGTQVDNLLDRTERGRLGTTGVWGKLTDADVLDIRHRYSERMNTMAELALLYGVSRVTISNVVRRKTHRTLENVRRWQVNSQKG